jgi:hypothetical protein
MGHCIETRICEANRPGEYSPFESQTKNYKAGKSRHPVRPLSLPFDGRLGTIREEFYDLLVNGGCKFPLLKTNSR